MSRGKFVPNPGFEALLLRSREVREVVEDLTEVVADEYRDGVPVDEGTLKDSIFTDVAVTENGVVGRVGAKAGHAGLIEFGNNEHAPDGSLRRAVDKLGGDYVPWDGS